MTTTIGWAFFEVINRANMNSLPEKAKQITVAAAVAGFPHQDGRCLLTTSAIASNSGASAGYKLR
jgi:hypothetical protein